MKINEIIVEAAKGKFRPEDTAAIPDLETYQQLDNNNSPYLAYRFGMAMAGAPEMKIDVRGPIGGQFTTITYSKGDAEILDAAKRIMGVSSNRETPGGSQEPADTHKSSPVQARGPVKLKKR